MKETAHSFDRAAIEMTAAEMAVLSDLLAQAMGYQESDGKQLDPDVREIAESLYAGLNQTLRTVWSEDEARSGPFAEGDDVMRVFDDVGNEIPVPRRGTVLSQHGPGGHRDYSWSVVRFEDGADAEVATHDLRRTRSGGP